MPVFDRADLLRALSAKLHENRSLVIETIIREAGKVIGETTTETDRGIFTTETAAEEAKRIDGVVIPLNLLPSSKGRFGIVRPFPISPIAGISPCTTFRSTWHCKRLFLPWPRATRSCLSRRPWHR